MKIWIQKRSWYFLRIFSSLEYRMQRRFTSLGQLVLLGTFMGALFGIDTKQTLGVQLFGLGIGLTLVALSSNLRRLKGLKAQRQLPPYATVGVPLQYRVIIENVSKHSTWDCIIQEALPDPRPNLEIFLETPTPYENRSNSFDTFIGYPRWRWLVQQGQKVLKAAAIPLPALIPGAKTTLELNLIPCRRGLLQLHNLEAKYTDVLGLTQRQVSIAPKAQILVLPQRYPIPMLQLLGRRRLQPGGISLANTVGESQEFIGLREYRPGDSPRLMDWAAWARSNEPVVKEYRDEYFSRYALILDSFVPLARQEDFEAAVSVAASFVEPLQGNDSLLDLMFVADKAYIMTSGRGLLTSTALLEVLAYVQPQPYDEFSTLSETALNAATLLSAVLCILLSWDSQRQAFVQKLRMLGMPVRVLLIGSIECSKDIATMSDQNFYHLDPQSIATGLANFGTLDKHPG